MKRHRMNERSIIVSYQAMERNVIRYIQEVGKKIGSAFQIVILNAFNATNMSLPA